MVVDVRNVMILFCFTTQQQNALQEAIMETLSYLFVYGGEQRDEEHDNNTIVSFYDRSKELCVAQSTRRKHTIHKPVIVVEATH